MSGMWQKLFAESPPPEAMQNLLTPRRKLIYGLFAFAPGTLLALYLNSVKRRMNEENEQLRVQHIQDELAGDIAREEKDLVLTQMIDELRDRIQRLEREARGDTIAHKASTAPAPASDVPASKATNRGDAAPAPAAVGKPSDPRARTELPSFLDEYEANLRPWLDRLDMLKAELEKLQERLAPAPTSSDSEKTSAATSKRRSAAITDRDGVGASGIRGRVAERERTMLAQDVRAARQQAAQSNSSKAP